MHLPVGDMNGRRWAHPHHWPVVIPAVILHHHHHTAGGGAGKTVAADADGLLVDVVHAIDRVAAHRDRHTEGWPSTRMLP